MRHHAPHTTCLSYVEDGIHHFPERVLGRSASGGAPTQMLRDEMLDLLPLGIGQVCGVSLSGFHTLKCTPLLGY